MSCYRYLLLGFCLTIVGGAHATDAYPSKPITIVVPFPPGGSTDAVARSVAQGLTTKLGWNVIVENKPGAGGALGLNIAAASAPDGYTVVLGQTSNLVTDPLTRPGSSKADGLVPIVEATSYPMVLMVSAQSGIRTMGDFVNQARKKEGGLTFANVGTGTVSHLSAEDLEQRLGVKFLHVPYKGNGPAMNDLMGGQVDVFFSSSIAAFGQERSGKASVIAVASEERVKVRKDIPTIAEDIPGYQAISWNGFLVPKGTQLSIVGELNKQINAVLASKEFVEVMEHQGMDVVGGTPAHFAGVIEADTKRWGKLLEQRAASSKTMSN